MSGIVGIVNFDGAPVDRELLSRMTASLDFRGPDARNVMWIDGSSGFGHTLLRTTYEAEHEQQPFTFDRQTFIVADCRVDARAELISKLKAKGRDANITRPDVELILHAWHAWGEECVEHLLGDFAFAIWDASRHRLFCARDHMGVKPFYYAHIGSTVIFSNTLDCVRLHPAVSNKLNDLAVADFLLLEINREKDTTTFADIQRIAPAHTATWTANGLHLRRYWTLPIDEPVYFKRLDDYTDRFKALLNQAVKDRLRTPRVSVFMSGGLDSSTLAATARDNGAQVQAFTTTWKGYDEERHYAGLVASHLGIPIDFRERAEDVMDPQWHQTSVHTPEPVADPLNLRSELAYTVRVAQHSRVGFWGEGPDNALLYEWQPYLRYLQGRRKFGRLIYDMGAHMLLHRRILLLPSLRRIVREKRRGEYRRWDYPQWLNPEFESRLDLRSRLEDLQAEVDSPHPVRPAGYLSFDIVQWQAIIFEGLDSGSTSAPFEVRHPFVDLRLLRYMLSVPAMPWCRVKYLERRAMRNVLPEPVLRRPKSPFPHDPVWDCLKDKELPIVRQAPASLEYVAWERVPRTVSPSFADFRTDLRPFTLNYWLHNLDKTGQTNKKEDELSGQTRNDERWGEPRQEALHRTPAGNLR